MKKKGKSDEITIKKRMFADKYIELGSAEKAALAVGYSKTYARARSYKLLEDVGISLYIENKMNDISKPTIAKAEEVLEYLTRVMRGEEKDQFDLDAPLCERTRCAEDLGKRYKLFTDKLEISGKVNISEVLKKARERVKDGK
jgi:phage terminase small subunit